HILPYPTRRSSDLEVDGIRCTVEGRADGIFTDGSGCPVIDEIKTTGVPSAEIHDGLNPCHWAQGMVYAALYTAQQGLAGASVRLTYYQIDDDKIFCFTRHFSSAELEDFLLGLLRQYAPWARRQLDWSAARTASLQAMRFPYDGYRPGQRPWPGRCTGPAKRAGRPEKAASGCSARRPPAPAKP